MFHIGDTVRVIHDTSGHSIGDVDKIKRIHLTKSGTVLCELHHHWVIYPAESLELVTASDYPEVQIHNVGDIVRRTKGDDDVTYKIVSVRPHISPSDASTILYRIYESNDDERTGSSHLVHADAITSITYSLF